MAQQFTPVCVCPKNVHRSANQHNATGILTFHKVLGEDVVGRSADDATVGHGCV